VTKASNIVEVENLIFHFSESSEFLAYDKTAFQAQRSNLAFKAVDVVCLCLQAEKHAWYIEVKDFRVITQRPNPSNLENLHKTLVKKYEDTRNGLSILKDYSGDTTEVAFAREAMQCNTDFIALHLEPHEYDKSLMFPYAVLSKIRQKVKILLHQKNLKAYVNILNIQTTSINELPWIVTSKI
jgi:hypothetical protein